MRQVLMSEYVQINTMNKADTYTLRPDQPFDLDITLKSGQAFRWIFDKPWWKGYICNNVVFIRQDGSNLHYSGVNEDFLVRYFNLEQDLLSVYASLSLDPYLKQAISNAPGLRIIRQNPWECMVCHICSNRTQKTSVLDRITRIAEILGNPVRIENESYYIFPSPQDIIDATSYQIRNCNLGYLSHRYLISLAKHFIDEPLWLESLNHAPYPLLVQILHKTGGVSKKAAEYIAFSAFGALEAFPVDGHIRNLFLDLYMKERIIKWSDPQALDHIIGQEAQRMFGRYAAYAFEYLVYSGIILQKKFKID